MASPEHMVYQALQIACSQNTDLLKQAQQKLEEWETEPGFYSTLANILSNQNADANVRWMAAVCFKNGVNKYWRRNAKNEIDQQEKIRIRSQLLTTFNEPFPQIAVQIAALIAKIARLDSPKEWPELITVLLESVKTDDNLRQHRALLILQHVIKALASKRMVADRKVFEQLTNNVYRFILILWDGFTDLFFQSLQSNTNSTDNNPISYLEKAILSLRILRKLTIYGFQKPHKSENCMAFIEALFRRIKESVECRFQLKLRHESNIVELLEKFILKQTKILNEFLEQHPLSFMSFVATSLEFSFNYVFSTGTNMIYDGNVINFPNFAIHCTNLMKGSLSSSAYNNYVLENVSSSDVDIPVAVTAKNNFFTQERISYICEKLITHYFLLTKIDLDAWSDDPEGFAADEGGESWKYALRPCAETFFLTLMLQYRKEVTAEVVKYIEKAQQNTLTIDSTMKDILLKDAIYIAAGLSAFNLYDEVDFDAWFLNQLITEIKIPAPDFRIIRRRIIWLIGQWTGVKFSRNLRPEVYNICIQLLNPQEDVTVRISAAKTLMSTMDDFDFEAEPFLQYLGPSFDLLFSLLKESKECDTKMNVLSTMSFIVGKMSDNIQPQAESLIGYLPLLWKESETHNMLRCAIISTLIQIVKALGEIPEYLSHFLYPIIDISTDVSQASYIYLMEEGLELWNVVVENCSSLSPELLSLCKNIVPIIEITSENLRSVLSIVQAYVILCPQSYLQNYGKQIITMCADLLGDMRLEGIIVVMTLFDTCLQADPDFSLNLLRPVLPSIFKKIYENADYPMLMSMYLGIVARVLMINHVAFIQILQELNIPNAFDQILEVWIVKMPLVSRTEKRKLLALALCYIITIGSDVVFEKFSGILQNICEALNDILRLTDGVMTDTLVYADENDLSNTLLESYEFETRTYHFERYKNICFRDPVHRINLKDYFQSQLTTLRNSLGNERYQSLMSTNDVSTLSNIQEYVDIHMNIPK